MTEIKVPDMHCENCVKRISNLFDEEGLEYRINLEKRSVEVGGNEKEIKKAMEALDDLGFEGVL